MWLLHKKKLDNSEAANVLRPLPVPLPDTASFSSSIRPSVWSHLLSLVLHQGWNCWGLVRRFFVLWFVQWHEGQWASGHFWQSCLERAWSIWELQELNLCENISLPQWNANTDSILSLESQGALSSLLKSRQKTKTKEFSLFPWVSRGRSWLCRYFLQSVTSRWGQPTSASDSQMQRSLELKWALNPCRWAWVNLMVAFENEIAVSSLVPVVHRGCHPLTEGQVGTSWLKKSSWLCRKAGAEALDRGMDTTSSLLQPAPWQGLPAEGWECTTRSLFHRGLVSYFLYPKVITHLIAGPCWVIIQWVL